MAKLIGTEAGEDERIHRSAGPGDADTLAGIFMASRAILPIFAFRGLPVRNVPE